MKTQIQAIEQQHAVTIQYPGGFCEPSPNAHEAEAKIKAHAEDYEGEARSFWEQDSKGEGWESRGIFYRNWQRVETFAGRITGALGTIL